MSAGGNNIVIGFGAALWRRLSASPPADLGVFEPIDGLDGHAAPSTQHDIWVWIHGTGADVVLGFVDGTENPGPSDAARVASIADGRPGAGGSHVIAQRWVHDLDSFNHLEVNQQQEVVGRTKPDSVALPRDVRPVDAHIMRAELLDDDGEERQIYRRSVPFGMQQSGGCTSSASVASVTDSTGCWRACSERVALACTIICSTSLGPSPVRTTSLRVSKI